ncbi:hypothetical protein [Aquimarina aggregata]|uniref:hypothetical protein n=1 Tax=Aquimarina aggregata TaxID=1642818 RepID=UPI00249278F3|nr:hypothetical protein [Aquimarina aggregata]
MKKIVIISIAALVLFISCEDNDDASPYGDFSSLSWITTQGFEEADYALALNNYIGFRDLSRNTVSHQWIIPSGTNLLSEAFDAERDTIFTNFISSAGPLSSDEDIVNVIFRTPGIKEIELKNVFKDSVAESVFNNGVWVVNKTFTVNVFDDIKPMIKVMKGTEEVLSVSESDMADIVDSSSWPTVVLEAGEQLTYIDMTTTGSPDARRWSFDGGNIEQSRQESVNVIYNRLGSFLAGSITSVRNDEEKPEGEVTKLIPLNIKVTASSKPFILNGTITENESEVISFKVTGEVESLRGEEGNFTVNVTNIASGFNQDIPVRSVTINSNDATQIDLELTEPIFNSDAITIKYTSGNIQSVDFRILSSFGPEPVTMNFQGSMNISGFTGYELEWNGAGNQFKLANTVGYFGQHNANNEAGPLYYFRDTDMAFEGNSSMKFETPATGIPNLARLQGTQFNTLSPVSEGTYIPSVWVFLDNLNTMTTIEYNFTNDPSVFIFDITTTPRGEWVQLMLPEVSLGDINTGRFDINIRNTGQNDAIVQKLWMDNFDLLIVESRL